MDYNLIELLNEFNSLYHEKKEKLPYHFNLIDEIHANENAHSRILSKILKYKKNNKLIFLESFLNKVCKLENPTKDLEVKK